MPNGLLDIDTTLIQCSMPRDTTLHEPDESQLSYISMLCIHYLLENTYHQQIAKLFKIHACDTTQDMFHTLCLTKAVLLAVYCNIYSDYVLVVLF